MFCLMAIFTYSIVMLVVWDAQPVAVQYVLSTGMAIITCIVSLVSNICFSKTDNISTGFLQVL